MPAIKTEQGYVELKKGESGQDEFSSGCCPACYSEAGDYGLVYFFKWQDEPAGWNMWGGCSTCSYSEKRFVPYKEEE